jgi:hypothetical protein
LCPLAIQAARLFRRIDGRTEMDFTDVRLTLNAK